MRYSVIVPAYNAASTIERTLRSVLAQEPPPAEIVVGDDASTDDTVSLAEGLGARVLRLPKGNGSVARNRAAALAESPLLLFMDADDEWLPGKAAAHLAAWASESPSFVLDGARRVRPDGSSSATSGFPDRRPVTWEDMTDHQSWTCGSAFSISASHYEKVGGFNEALPAMQDVEFWIRAAHELGPGLNLGEVLTIYYQTGGSVSKAPRDVSAQMARLRASMPFLGTKHERALANTLHFQNALNAGFPGCLRHFAAAGWPVGDPRLLRYLAITIKRRLTSKGTRSV